MRNVTPDTLTTAVQDTFKCENPRVALLVAKLIEAVHAYAIDVKLTHAEWREAIGFLTRAGDISDEERNEFVLLSDVLGLSSLVDMINSPLGATESSVLGPFHILGAPPLAVGGDLIGDNPGDHIVVYGQVRNLQGQALEGAKLEIWQTAENGLYSNQDQKQSEFNLRCQQVAGVDGRFAFTTVRPAPYMVPSDGPVGDLLRAGGRHPWRPSHLHFIVMAEGYRTLVTELFPEDDAYLDADAVFGVRESLVLNYKRHDTTADLPVDVEAKDRLKTPYFSVQFDFTLAPD